MAAAAVLTTTAASADFVKVTNLVTSDPLDYPAPLTDPALVNAWGLSHSAGSPFWVSDNGTGVSTVYRVDPVTDATTKLGLTVTIPGDGAVTGQAFNTGAGGGAFNKDNFLFVSEDGTISGWRGALGTTAEVLQIGSTANSYKGTTMGTVGGHGYLYSANFATGMIDVMKGDAAAPNLAGTFTDPGLPAGYTPFNVQILNNSVFVAYALNGGADEVAGPGLGFVSQFDMDGNFIARVASNGNLNAPWGLAIAPDNFGAFAGDLLVGNFGDGTINAYDLTIMSWDGMLMGSNGKPLAIEGLWALMAGNGGLGGSAGSIYFSAGPDDESEGLFGSLSFVPEPASMTLLLGGLLAVGWRRRKTSAA